MIILRKGNKMLCKCGHPKSFHKTITRKGKTTRNINECEAIHPIGVKCSCKKFKLSAKEKKRLGLNGYK
jgi:hypothetical protein